MNMKLKTLAATMLVAGVLTGCNDRAERSAYTPPEPSAVEDSTIAETDRQNPITNRDAVGDGNYDDGRYGSAAQRDRDLAEIDHHEVVKFKGATMEPASEDKLQGLVESLDKDKPVEVIVAIEEGAIQSQPPTAPGAVTPDTADPSQQTQTGAAFAEQVDELRTFMQEQGVKVVQWRFEGSSQDPASIEQPGLTQDQQMEMSQEDMQQVRIVISNDFE